MAPFLISVPVFLIIAAGWLFKKYKIADEIWVHILNRFAYYISLPAVIVSSFWSADFADKEYLKLVGWSSAFILAFMVLTVLVLSLMKLSYKTKAAIFLIVCTGNTVYMGFPIITNAFGSGALAAGSLVAVLYLILPILASIFVIRIWANGRRSFASQLAEFFKNPLTISAIAGVAVSFVPKQILGMDIIYKSVSLLGATASPVALFALGAFLYKRFLKKDLALVFSSSLAKILGFPLLAYIAGNLISVPKNEFGLLVMMAAMPSAVTTFVIAEKFSLNEGAVGNALLVSTILSFFVIPFVAAIL